jgi:phage terminase large subunit-like protein
MLTTTSATLAAAEPGCIDCGWQPAPGELWPTEGPLAVRWMQRFLICAEGDWFGKPLTLRRDQKRFVYEWYSYCPDCGYWRYDTALRGEATGGGKTTFAAGLENLEMFGPPQIVPVSPNIINAAASFEQADLLFNIAGVMLGGRDEAVKEAPLCGYAEVYDTEIRYADGRPGLMKRVAAVAGTNEGGLPSLFVCDEVHEWGDIGSTKARVHMVIGKSTKKRRLVCRMPDGREVTRGPGRILNISTAGFDVDHSLLGAMYKHGKLAVRDRSLAPRLLFDWREAPDGIDFAEPGERRRAVIAGSAAAGILWDVEARVREWDKPEVEHHEWIRYYANSWVGVAADSWLAGHPAAWGKCQGEWELAGDEPTVLAIDMSRSRDTTAVVECTQLPDGRVAAAAKIWKPAGRLIPHKDVSGYVLQRMDELGGRFAGVVYDPAWAVEIAEDIEDAGVVPIEFSQAPSFMAPAVARAFDAIVGGVLVHDGDPDFGTQVKSAARQYQKNGFTLSKGQSRGKIDAAVALCMALEGLARLAKEVDIMQTIW